MSPFVPSRAHLVLAESSEDLKEIAGGQVGDIHSVRVSDPREHVADLHVIDSDEVMQTRQISDEVLSRFEAKDIEHEVFADVLEPPDTRRRRKFYARALEGSFAEQQLTSRRSLGRHEDDDAIVAFEFQ